MSPNRLGDYLDQMLEATQLACSYIDGLDKSEFLNDKKTQQALILNLLIVGENATRMLQEYPEFLANHPEIPWRSMKGMRNRIAHGYFDINLDVVWDTVKTALPDLLQRLPAIRASLP